VGGAGDTHTHTHTHTHARVQDGALHSQAHPMFSQDGFGTGLGGLGLGEAGVSLLDEYGIGGASQYDSLLLSQQYGGGGEGGGGAFVDPTTGEAM